MSWNLNPWGLVKHLQLYINRNEHYYLPPADRPGMGDYKMPSVRASVRHAFTKAFLSLKIL